MSLTVWRKRRYLGLLLTLSLIFVIEVSAAEEGIGASSGTSEKRENSWSDGESSFPELEVLEELSFEKSLKLLDEAEENYKRSESVMNGTELRDVEELFRMDQGEPRFEWEKKEIEEARLRAERNARSRNRSEALGFVIRSMKAFDRIKNPNLQSSERYLNLQKKIFQSYIGLQFQSGNYLQCVEMTLNYLRLNPENEKEREPHRILAISFSRLAELARNSGDFELYRSHNVRRKEHLLKYAEYTYGVDSQEYRRLSERLKSDPKYR
jgi:hypothetical protein